MLCENPGEVLAIPPPIIMMSTFTAQQVHELPFIQNGKCVGIFLCSGVPSWSWELKQGLGYFSSNERRSQKLKSSNQVSLALSSIFLMSWILSLTSLFDSKIVWLSSNFFKSHPSPWPRQEWQGLGAEAYSRPGLVQISDRLRPTSVHLRPCQTRPAPYLNKSSCFLHVWHNKW